MAVFRGQGLSGQGHDKIECPKIAAAHIEIRVGGSNAVDDPKDKQDEELFLAGALKSRRLRARKKKM
jgi:hypothetical protein